MIDIIPTHINDLDQLLVVGGIPRGRITEVQGDPDSGKTFFVLSILAGMQQDGSVALYCDLDCKLMAEHLGARGINMDMFYLLQPPKTKIDELLSDIEKMLSTKAVDVFVVDSLAMIDDIAGFCSRLACLAAKYNVAVILVNQYRHCGERYIIKPLANKTLDMFSSIRIRLESVGELEFNPKIVRNKLASLEPAEPCVGGLSSMLNTVSAMLRPGA